MADSTVNQKQLSITQIGVILNDIAITAKSIERCANLIDQSGDDLDDIGSLTVAIEKMAQRVGFLADTAVHGTDAEIVYSTSAEDWMMPPAYWPNKEVALV